MNLVGGFREGEIDGKPFHIFSLLLQTDDPSSSSSSGEAAIDSGGESDFSLQPLFLCPTLRFKVEITTRKKKGYDKEEGDLPLNTPPHLGEVRTTAKNFCKLPVSPLFWCNNKDFDYHFHCRACGRPELSENYYFCVTCGEQFHKECVQSPLEIKHPSYPFLSLQLYDPPNSFKNSWTCIFCQKFINGMCYHCPTYNVSKHTICLMKPIPILIDHPKRHRHSLTYFPKQASLACDVCGLIKELIATYVCLQCVFVVHQDCIYFPYVIKISRHQHRITFTSSVPFGKWSCGVCRREVNNSCGTYSCKKCKDYYVHPRCALREDVWDGQELEDVPEEPEISDGIILHFSHGHHLKLEISRVYEEDKFCHGSILPIYEGNYYSCMDQLCDFILHETCANAPRKKHHALSPLPLMLTVVTNGYGTGTGPEGHLCCTACKRESCGFVYEDSGILSRKTSLELRLDIRCASVSEPFEYQGHEHLYT